MALSGMISIVTGASRGIGRGIALQLGEAGATVYVTGRQPHMSLQATDESLPTLEKTAQEVTERGGKGIAVYVDHSDMNEVEKFFNRIHDETEGKIDILVNNAFSAIADIEKTVGKTFWEMDSNVWDQLNNVGLRNNYYCCVYAARMMTKYNKGLIINISSAGAIHYLFTVAYGVGKSALDRMSSDMAHEIRSYGVTVLSLWPGAVRTEMFKKIADSGVFEKSSDKILRDMKKHVEEGETPEFTGKAIVALATDPNVFKKSGRTLITADLAIDYQFRDIDGRQPDSIRSLKNVFKFYGFESIGIYIPSWLRLPGWFMVAINSRL